MKGKAFKLEYDNIIPNFDDLITQLESLKTEAMYMLPQDKIFQRDFHALAITIKYLKENKTNINLE